jgi:predicted Ser/Thr protein kinase
VDTAYRVSPLHPDDPDRLGVYPLAGRLGSGGMGVVYLGRDPDGSYVAVKVVHAALAGSPEARERFRREVERARQVPPFCTAEVVDVDLDHDPAYLVIEYVDGPSLAEVVRERGPMNAAHLHATAVGVATALTAIHGAGVIHRDLKPENVLLPPGSPKVIDFGIAQGFTATSQLTETGTVVGTIGYLAPERLDGATPVTAAADVFAWGCVVAYGGTGRSPFGADTPIATAGRIMTQPPELGGLDEPLRGIVEASLVKEPELRPTARELLDMLLAASDTPQPSDSAPAARSQSRPPAPAPRPGRRPWVGRRTVTAAASLLAVGSVAALLAVAPRFGARPTDRGVAAPSAGATPSGHAGGDNGAILISDRLKAPSQWRNTEGRFHEASCTVANGLTVVRRGDRDSFMCSGSELVIKDGFTARITVTLGTRGSCAALYFRWNPGRGGDILRICQGSIAVVAQTADASTVIGTINAVQPIQLNRPANIRMAVDQNVVQVFRGGGLVGEIRLPSGGPTEGKLRLGINAETDSGQSPFTVTLADLEVRAL